MDGFVEAWAHADPYATGRLTVTQLAPLIRTLRPPLGLDPNRFEKEHVVRRSGTRAPGLAQVEP
jgi:hypothetical protein